nr:hypothetical protein [Pandoravirus massiliensis]
MTYRECPGEEKKDHNKTLNFFPACCRFFLPIGRDPSEFRCLPVHAKVPISFSAHAHATKKINEKGTERAAYFFPLWNVQKEKDTYTNSIAIIEKKAKEFI